jgi:hypothetical protein
MSAGLTAALARIEAIVEGVNLTTPWVKSAHPILGTQFLEELTNPTGQPLDRHYWVTVAGGPRTGLPVSGSLADSTVDITIDLVRQWAGRWDGVDHLARIKSCDPDALIVEHSLLNPTNWAYSTSGIILVNTVGSGKGPILVLPSLVWQIDLAVTLRVADAGVIVP